MGNANSGQLWGIPTDALVVIFLALIALGIAAATDPDAFATIALVLVLSALFIAVFRNFTDEKTFVTRVFLLALAARMVFGILMHAADLREFFAGDANTYDFYGTILRDYWFGTTTAPSWAIHRASDMSGSGWGMFYLVAGLYTVFGRNILAAQSFCAVVGAATAPMVFYCSQRIYGNLRSAKAAAVIVAVFPAFVIWSGQLLKDGLIIFLLVLAMTMVLVMQEKIRAGALAILGIALAGILTLRFYIFFMVVAAVVGSFVIGVTNSARSMIARTVILAVLGLGLTYIGVTSIATGDFDRYANLEQLQNSRLDQARTGKSGYAADADVSTTEGVITVLPVGFVYLMFAPFPWAAKNLRQAIPIPEVLVWWAMMPLLFSGLVYSLRHRLRKSLPILLFSLMLTLVYSVSQGNVGTAYRQRTQIQVFLVIIIAVGWGLYKEKQEDKRLANLHHRALVDAALRSRIEDRSERIG
ncbi:MAG: glycosyltransferase family 39 protein [Acidobacteriota bacterium]